ncbi:ileal sodium/bile acid cotransporter [Biomphalaria pfeifferi]|uniref:Ileal sodium/bile acid cotransporter n=1 Tax=Biomphalaria pfeifferi TaxID=112525 RepID=A0AAD8F673_BIOPF|nr:ileal sodium/bile acid cotransporter [Biomphalaria pfeifferi]
MLMKLFFIHTLHLICLCFLTAQSLLVTGSTKAKYRPLPFEIKTNESFPYTVIENEVSQLIFYYSFNTPNVSIDDHIHAEESTAFGSNYNQGTWIIEASLDLDHIAELKGEKIFFIDQQFSQGNISVLVTGNLPGRTLLSLCAMPSNGTMSHGTTQCQSENMSYRLFVERRHRPIDVAFNIVLILLVVLTNVGMGAKIDLNVMKSELRRPIAPAIGLCCQFVIMPLIAFGIAYSFKLDPGITLGFFALGCAPGGSASNAYTYLLGGNVSLSVTMTLISTFAALGLLPMWLFTLGTVVYDTGDVKIPYENIFISLLGIIIPAVVGLVLQRKFPKIAKMFVNAVKYIVILMVVFIMTVGVYANVYVFYLLSGEVLLAAATLPYLGFLLGGLVALIFRQNKVNIITIAVETGIQNTGIPIVLLRLSLTGPDKDTSTVAPVASAMFTPIPLMIGVIYVQTRLYLEKRKKNKKGEAEKTSQNRKEEPDVVLSPTDNICLVSSPVSSQI